MVRWTIVGLAVLLACNPADKAGTTDMGSSSAATSGDPGSSSTTTTAGTTGAPTTQDPTTTPPDPTAGAEPMFCVESCVSDEDCLTKSGLDVGEKCIDGACDGIPFRCTDDASCLADVNLWTDDCAAQADCGSPEVCIDVGGGAGKCAHAESDTYPCFADEGTLTMPKIEGGEVVVCAVIDGVCHPYGWCYRRCESDADCGLTGAPHCMVAEGWCGCESDADCAPLGEPERSRCVGGVCGCGDDSDCGFAFNADTCYQGACGCSSGASCSDTLHMGTTIACVKTCELGQPCG